MTRSTALTKRLIGGAALVVLVVVALLNTKFLTPEEVEALTPEQFDPAQTAQELYAQAQGELIENPANLAELAEALDEDPEAAIEDYSALTPSEGTFAFPVTVTATVAEASPENLQLSVEGIEDSRSVVVALGNAIDGNLFRDLTGFSFGDAPGQTDYQRVGNELATLMRGAATEALGEDPASIQGEEITLDGILRYVSTDTDGPDQRPLVIQPVTIGDES